jgi:hypothetical protein
LRSETADGTLANVDRNADHCMRVSISVYENTNARHSTTLFHDLPVARHNGDVVDVDMFAVAGLVVADKESDVFS